MLGDSWLAEEQTNQSEVAAGAPDKIRTCDLCLRRAALYPAELRARVAIFIAEPGRYGNAAKRRGTARESAAAPCEKRCGTSRTVPPVLTFRRETTT
jgi:hypothetical protein